MWWVLRGETPRLGEVDWTVEMALDLGRKNFTSKWGPWLREQWGNDTDIGLLRRS